jgi:hypothetical protein
MSDMIPDKQLCSQLPEETAKPRAALSRNRSGDRDFTRIRSVGMPRPPITPVGPIQRESFIGKAA